VEKNPLFVELKEYLWEQLREMQSQTTATEEA
jgi:hypothetical protein